MLINKDIPAERCIGLLKAPHPRVVLFPRQHADGGPRFLALAALYAPEHSPRGEKGAAPTSGDRQSRGMFRVFVVVDSTSKVAVGSMSTGSVGSESAMAAAAYSPPWATQALSLSNFRYIWFRVNETW